MTDAERRFFELVDKGVFEVRDDGTVWRIKHTASLSRRLLPITPRQVGRADKNGYLAFGFKCDGVHYYTKAHRVVYIKFHGDIQDRNHINHKNGNTSDNRPDNLESVTPSENCIHALQVLGTFPHGDGHYRSKLTEEEVRTIRSVYTGRRGQITELAMVYGVSKSSIKHVIHRRSWKHVS